MGNIFSSCGSSPVRERATPASTPATTTTTSTPSSPPAPAQQPRLAPDDWFLSADELAASRGEVPRTDVAVSSAGNDVVGFVSSDEHFAGLYEAMEHTHGPEDFIWLAGWTLDHEVPLRPRDEAFGETTLRRVVERAVLDRRVQVRALIWANLLQRPEVLATRDWMNGLAKTPTGGSALFVFDNRLPRPLSSHHQKFIVIRRGPTLTVFAGGLDITRDRWDSARHDTAELRETRGIAAGHKGWVDAGLRITGPLAMDYASTFIGRWNSAVRPANCWKEELLDFENPETIPDVATVEKLKQAIAHRATDAGADGRAIHAQLVRTYSPLKPAMYAEFAPRGELSLLHARLKAIRQARNFIYVEDQYFFFMPQLMEALREALARVLKVVVVVQRPSTSTQSKVSGYAKLLYEMARPLLDAFPAKFHLFTTKAPRELYVHTKLLIVDDVFVSLGSANWNRRSTTSDSEVAASLVDSRLTTVTTTDEHALEVGAFVRDFRVRKFAEFCNAAPTALEGLGIAEGCARLEAAVQDPAAILDRLEVEAKWEFHVFTKEFSLKIVDPDDLNDPDGDGDDTN